MLTKIASSMSPLLREHPDLHIGINLAPQHFASTQIIDMVSEATRNDLPASRLIFEITERGLVADENSIARTVMSGLARMGARLAVDDFGTGYSSLSYLQRSRSITSRWTRPSSMASRARQRVPASWTRSSASANRSTWKSSPRASSSPIRPPTSATRAFELAQGWFFARPMPARKFEEFVRQRNSSVSPPTPRPLPTEV